MMPPNLNDMPPHLREQVLRQMGRENTSTVNRRRRRTAKSELENAVQKACLQYLKAAGYRAWRQNVGLADYDGRKVRFGIKGAADITGMMKDGRRLEIETKRRSGGVQSDDQKVFEAEIVAGGGVYILAASVDDLIEGLKVAESNDRQMKDK